jgi:glycosyltransferase involved in cell wall biosynthesis
MVRLAVNGVVSFSDAPLKLAIWAGAAVSALAAIYGAYAIFTGLFTDHAVRGWTSTVVIVSFLCGLNMLLTGMVGLYVGRIYSEVKRRPLYVVSRRIGFEEAQAAKRTSRVA